MMNMKGSPEQSEMIEALMLLAAALDAVGVRYMVTGSVAATFYGHRRSTADIDVVIDPAPAERAALIKVLTEDFDVLAETIREALHDNAMFSMIEANTLTKIDVIVRRRDSDPPAVFERRQSRDVDGQPVMVISLEDLVIAKLRWASDSRSALQLHDVHMLLGTPDIDREYIDGRARREDLLDVLEEATDARYE